MVFIVDVIKLFFEKKEKAKELELSEEQKRKYSKQFKSLMLSHTPIFFVFIFGLGDCVVLFLTKGEFFYLALAVLFGTELKNIAESTKDEILLIEERIEKRIIKNKKQGSGKNEQ